MKTVKLIMTGAFALALLSPLTFAADTHAKCCEKAKAEGKECDHKCCVEAKKAGKDCEKCGAKKADAPK